MIPVGETVDCRWAKLMLQTVNMFTNKIAKYLKRFDRVC